MTDQEYALVRTITEGIAQALPQHLADVLKPLIERMDSFEMRIGKLETPATMFNEDSER
jgi:hypothetical protein